MAEAARVGYPDLDVGSPRGRATVPARTPRRIDRAVAGLRAVRAVGLTDLVRTATDQASEGLAGERTLPVLPELRPLLPSGGLRRGATIAAVPGKSVAASLILALLAAASEAGSWCGVVGVPTLNAVAAADMGIALERLALVPSPGEEWAATVAALLDGLDVVVAAPPGPVAASLSARLAARARHRGSILVPYGQWQGADLSIETVRGSWHGLGAGRGRLRRRELTLRAWGKGAAAVPREVSLWLPGPPPAVATDATSGSSDLVGKGSVLTFRAAGTGGTSDRDAGRRKLSR